MVRVWVGVGRVSRESRSGECFSAFVVCVSVRPVGRLVAWDSWGTRVPLWKTSWVPLVTGRHSSSAMRLVQGGVFWSSWMARARGVNFQASSFWVGAVNMELVQAFVAGFFKLLG